MDALSDILRMLRIHSSVYFRSEFKSPWGMDVSRSPFAQFHMIVRGNCWLQVEGSEKPAILSGGDIVLFPHGAPHWLADHPDSPRLPGPEVVQAVCSGEAVFQEGESSTTIICGHFEYDNSFDHPFLKALPEMIFVSNTEPWMYSWMEMATHVLIQEIDSGLPGAEVVVERLAESLLVQILRLYIQQTQPNSGFWAALSDSRMNTALKLMHTQPETNWTLDSLARHVGMSRSGFAAQFKQMVGQAPMEYLTRWRMYKARDLLHNKQLSLLDIAENVGYLSEAAFNRAFKRTFDLNPGVMRKQLLRA